MSERINEHDSRATIRRQLLTTVSALALFATVAVHDARAGDQDADRPVIWIELGGQLSRLEDGQEMFSPALMAARPAMFAPSQGFEKPPLNTIDETGKISFQPDNSDWVISASIRYGRSSSKRQVHQQSYPKPLVDYVPVPPFNYQTYTFAHAANKFADTDVQNSEQHSIVDFQAGKDVGLGMFGLNGSSVLSLGVRFAQFRSKSNIALHSDPDAHATYYRTIRGYKTIHGNNLIKFLLGGIYHSNAAAIAAKRSFQGMGPSISWSASAPAVGNPQTGEIAFDWSLNAAVLFGRQKTRTHRQTTAQYHKGRYILLDERNSGTGYGRTTLYRNNPPSQLRSHMVTVPNLGGIVGLSFRYANAKISMGYRADLFFGAMDGGIDAAKKENVGFYGPFASVSVGIGG